MSDYSHYLHTALTCAHQAGLLIKEQHAKAKKFDTKSNNSDCVTETDKASEELILSMIKSTYPTHSIISEESHCTDGKYDVTDNVTWLIDPIDGTNNFVHSLYHVCVSIAVMVNKEVVVGVVHSPILQETFHAVKGQGAYCNNQRIHVSNQKDLAKALVCTEFGYDRTDEGIELMLGKLRNLLKNKIQSIRMFGSCALTMCAVAMGRVDAYYEGKDEFQGPKPWDVTAGSLIVKEAGGVVYDTTGDKFSYWNGRVFVACTDELTHNVLSCINKSKL